MAASKQKDPLKAGQTGCTTALGGQRLHIDGRFSGRAVLAHD
jgi:hypothetical protein